MLRGFRLAQGSTVAEEQWAVAAADTSSTILRIASRSPQEHIYSYAKA